MRVQQICVNQINHSFKGKEPNPKVVAFLKKNHLVQYIIGKYATAQNPHIRNTVGKLNAYIDPEIAKARAYFGQYKDVYTRLNDKYWVRYDLIPNACKGYEEEFVILKNKIKPEIIDPHKLSDYLDGKWEPEELGFFKRIANYFYTKRNFKIKKFK